MNSPWFKCFYNNSKVHGIDVLIDFIENTWNWITTTEVIWIYWITSNACVSDDNAGIAFRVDDELNNTTINAEFRTEDA